MEEDIRQVPEFGRIVLRDWGKLVLRRSDLPSLIVEADEEFLGEVSTVVENGTLTLRIGRKWLDIVKNTFQRGVERQKVTYYVNVPALEVLEVTGAARVEADGLAGEAFELLFSGAGNIDMRNVEFGGIDVEMPGAGKLSISGTARDQRAVLSGAGSYQAGALECESAKVELKGVGKATVNVRDRLQAVVRGVGTVEYLGDPEVEKRVSGLGQVVRASSK